MIMKTNEQKGFSIFSAGTVLNRVLVFVISLLIVIYRRLISPLLPNKCRFTPTCSEYCLDALKEWGIIKGSWLGIRRISRCHPLSIKWGYDPVPRKNKQD